MVETKIRLVYMFFFFLKEEAGIRDLVRSGGLEDVYKRQFTASTGNNTIARPNKENSVRRQGRNFDRNIVRFILILWRKLFRDRWLDCLLYTSDAADERSSVDLGGRRIIKKQNT